MDAIGTKTAAELLGIADQVGTLTPGKQADLIITDVDPLQEIKALGDPPRMELVLRSGKPIEDHLA